MTVPTTIAELLRLAADHKIPHVELSSTPGESPRQWKLHLDCGSGPSYSVLGDAGDYQLFLIRQWIREFCSAARPQRASQFDPQVVCELMLNAASAGWDPAWWMGCDRPKTRIRFRARNASQHTVQIELRDRDFSQAWIDAELTGLKEALNTVSSTPREGL